MKRVVASLAALAFAISWALAQVGPPIGPGNGGGGGGGGGVSGLTTLCPASGPSTGTVTLDGKPAVNAQVGTTYTVATTDCGGLITQSNASASAYTLPATGVLLQHFVTTIANLGAGTLTISANASGSINGAATLVLTTGQSAQLVATDANGLIFAAMLGKGSSLALAGSSGDLQTNNGGGGLGAVTPTAFANGPAAFAGLWYRTQPSAASASSVGVAGSIYCSLFTTVIGPPGGTSFTVTQLGITINTLSAGNTSQALEGAIYNFDATQPNRPGTIVNGTSSFATFATGVATSVSAALGASISLKYNSAYWACAQTFDATVQYNAVSGIQTNGPVAVGSATLTSVVGSSTITGVSTTGTFGTWPATLHGSTFTEYSTVSHGPILGYLVSSVP